MAFLRCFQCKGKKKIAPLGFIRKECPSCHGMGFIVQSSNDDIKMSEISVMATPINGKTLKRRGRPPIQRD